MLVMYTMYQSINESTAKTAYLKMIDYWLLFCLLVPFITFMLEVYLFIKQSHASGVKMGSDKRKTGMFKYSTKTYMQFLVPLFTLMFIISYFTAAMVITMIS